MRIDWVEPQACVHVGVGLLQDDISKNAYGTFHVDRNRIQCSQKFYISLSLACTHTHAEHHLSLFSSKLYFSWSLELLNVNLRTRTTLYIYINLLSWISYLECALGKHQTQGGHERRERRKKERQRRLAFVIGVCIALQLTKW